MGEDAGGGIVARLGVFAWDSPLGLLARKDLVNARTRRLIAEVKPAALSLEHLSALRELIDWHRLEVGSADKRHFYLENTGHIRRTVRDVPHHRYGQVPAEFYIPTPKGRAAAA